eukprot:CAMPEP_0117495352 /NCGR_PEP_ID=MMETSP0784-20121206/20087_1 /TAXON_ID=39447 /ORGANISM="" /LENGTH=239 /DNA_ID=CAMNT_0005290269 /DNA_START=78 /DNA_END=794 /DNA_ORIENTATION=-
MGTSGDRPSKSEVLAKLVECLRQEFIGCKGEKYTMQPLRSEGVWSCFRRGKDGSRKKFTLWLDEPSGLVWWGSWSYYFDPGEIAKTAAAIHWHKASGEKASFSWWSTSAKWPPCTGADNEDLCSTRANSFSWAEVPDASARSAFGEKSSWEKSNFSGWSTSAKWLSCSNADDDGFWSTPSNSLSWAKGDDASARHALGGKMGWEENSSSCGTTPWKWSSCTDAEDDDASARHALGGKMG